MSAGPSARLRRAALCRAAGLLLLGAALSWSIGCAPRGTRPVDAVVVGRPVDAIGLDPARISDTESAEVTEQIFDHLVRHRRDSMEIEPALATSWETSDDGRTWLFHLRDQVRFHDGTPFDASAVVFSFERQRDPRHPAHQPDFVYWDTTYANISSVRAVDRLTVQMTLDRPYAPFLASLAMFSVSIVSPTAAMRWGADFARHPVGTGPFRFVEWFPGERIILEANRDYWDRPAPRYDRLVFTVIRDATQRRIALEGETIDVAESLAPEDLQFVELHPRLEVVRGPGSNVAYLAMNLDHPPFDDPRVRRAVAHAIHREALVKLAFQGLARSASSPLPPLLWGHVDGAPPAYDPVEARRLLREARVSPDLPHPKLYTFDSPRPYMPAPELEARMIQANLREVGLEVDLVRLDLASQLREVGRGDHDLCLTGWVADVGDPDNFLYQLFDVDNAVKGSARNVSFYRNPEVHGLLSWAQELGDRGARSEQYARVQALIARDVPIVPLAHADVAVAARSALRGLSVQPSSVVLFRHVEVRP